MRQNDYLRYINYPIIQDDKMFKVNSDTVALGMFMDNLNNKTVLDLGTNNGALLLYAHYKKAKTLIGVDIFKEALDLAYENIKNYTDDFILINSKIQDLDNDRVDAIVCNPPFFEGDNVRKNEYYRVAMFVDSLSMEDMFKAFKKNIKDNGEIYFIYSADNFPDIYNLCLKYKFKIMKLSFVYDDNRPYASRVLLKLKIGKMTKLKVLKPFIIKEGSFMWGKNDEKK